ncbi:MAG: hypothetical protein ACFFB0_17580 [Promethearchaeota archaeon]
MNGGRFPDISIVCNKDLDKVPAEVPLEEGKLIILKISFLTDYTKFRVKSFLKKLT